jgi:cysteinyl-tRNA synthetase
LLAACASVGGDAETSTDDIVIKPFKNEAEEESADTVKPVAATPNAAAPAKEVATIAGTGPGFPEAGPWITFYGTAKELGDLDRAAEKFRIINIEADPDVGAFTDDQIDVLKNGGKNKVISYLNIGACERWRTFWKTAPSGFVGCGRNTAAHLGEYEGFDEMWMNPANAAYRKLVVDHIAKRLVDRGVDGFFLDNMELLAHGADDDAAPCDE